MEFLIIDDHPLIRTSITSMIQHHFSQACCIEASSTEEALSLLQKHQPNLILLDLTLPHMQGVEALTTISTLHTCIPIMILSAVDNPMNIQQCLNAGAAGYLIKTESSQSMLSAMEAVLLGEKHKPHILENESLHITRQLKQAEQITARHIDVLQLMHTGKRNKEIANTLDISEATIKVHCRNIFKLLGVNTRHQAVQKALQLALLT